MRRVTAFRWVPEFAQGYVRDLRVRWALEEAGLPYEVRLIGGDVQASPEYRAEQPFGQVPVYEEDGLVLFESGAIVLHILDRAGIGPADAAGRAKVTQWVIAALNTIEPPLSNVVEIEHFTEDEEVKARRHPVVRAEMEKRTAELAAALEGRDDLAGGFSAADIIMATALRIAGDLGFLAQHPSLAAYKDRCIARPAFSRALEAQLADFRANAPAA